LIKWCEVRNVSIRLKNRRFVILNRTKAIRNLEFLDTEIVHRYYVNSISFDIVRILF